MTYRDEFDEPPRGNDSFLSRVGTKAAFFIVLIALSFMIGVVWKLYIGAKNPNEQNVPIVRADDNPFKAIPEDPGGMEIPHKDSTIFSSLKTDEDADRKIENLLADDDNEEPMPRSQLFAGLNTEKSPDLHADEHDTPLDQPVGDNAQIIMEQVKQAENVVDALVDDGVEAITNEPVENAAIDKVKETVIEPKKIEPVVKVVEAPKPPPTPSVAPAKTTSSSGDYYVQVGSVRSAEGAESEWKKFVKKYFVLSGMSHRVEKADLGDKGVFYRIQAGPVSKDKATATCEAIKKITPGGCLVKKK